jgi:DNA transposition AAA+ family ATPase
MTPFDKYSPEEKAACQRIDAWLAKNKQTRAWLHRASRISGAAVSQVLNGNYPTNASEHIAKMLDAISQADERGIATSETGSYVPTSITKAIHVVCDRSRKHGDFGTVYGAVGVGKTATIKRYAAINKATILLEADPDMSPRVMLAQLLEALSEPCPRTVSAMFGAAVNAMQNTTTLIIVDEAEIMHPSCLTRLRRLRDKAGVGVVLAGTERLMQLVGAERGAFDQIFSRTTSTTRLIKGISEDDHNAIARAALAEHDPSDAVLRLMWQYSKGSARMLTEKLIPALRDFGLGKHALTPTLVQKVVDAVL